VDVLFRGSQADIRYLNRDQIKIEVDIRNKPFTQELNVKLLAKNVQTPGAARAVAIRPDEITLKLDQEGEKQIPVKADVQGGLPEGYEVETITCAPASVLLQGPRQRLDEIESVRTVPIDIEGRIRSFNKLQTPIVSPSENWVGCVSPSNVAVEIKIVERLTTRALEGLPVIALIRPDSRPRLDFWPSKINVVLKGLDKLVRDVKPEDVQASVDCSTLQRSASYNLPVRVHAPAGVTAVGIEPPTVKVTVEDL
jgi:YbbR domain-containing protein